jgi:hypothetical protein
MLPSPRRDERGVSNVELVLYAPLLMIVILFAVQFCLVYLGNQEANAVARETARIYRTTHDRAAALQAGRDYARTVGNGTLEFRDSSDGIDIQPSGDDYIKVVVSGHAQQYLPDFIVPQVKETVLAPVEQFVEAQP